MSKIHHGLPETTDLAEPDFLPQALGGDRRIFPKAMTLLALITVSLLLFVMLCHCFSIGIALLVYLACTIVIGSVFIAETVIKIHKIRSTYLFNNFSVKPSQES